MFEPTEKQVNAIKAMENKLWYWESYSWNIRSFNSKEEFSDYFEKLQKKLKKRDKYMTAKKNWTLKQKIRTESKILFYITKLVERYWQNYTRKSLLKKFKQKNIPLDLAETAISTAIKKWIINEEYFIESFINRKLKSWKWKSSIIISLKKKWIPDNLDLNQYFNEYTDDLENDWLEKQFNIWLKKYKIEWNKIEYKTKQKFLKYLLNKWFSFNKCKEMFEWYEVYYEKN